ncbi:MAG: hypothetical protein IT532_05630 [Burkholderiales bacterium]|nr:hypothetical protein [Burkholderiales bacterium]
MANRLFYLLIALLLPLQGLQPFLHGHVGGLSHEARLAHFHVTAVTAERLPDLHWQAKAQVLQKAAASDSPSIGVGDSFRRQSILVWTLTPAIAVSTHAMSRKSAARTPVTPVAEPSSGRIAGLLPPALAPPTRG